MTESKIKNLEKRVTELEKRLNIQEDIQKDIKIPTYKTVRYIIDNTDDKYQNLMRICYLFGLEVSEMLPKKKEDVGFFFGNDFSEITIDGEDALLLKVPTIRQGGKSRTIAVPLNPKYEPWSKIILKFSEERGNELLYDKVLRTFQEHVENTFKPLIWPVVGKFTKKKNMGKIWDPSHDTSFSAHNLIEVREWELGLCHNFNDLDFRIYFGTEYSSDYRHYFNKLFFKSDIHDNKEIFEAIKLKNKIFNPRESVKYRFKEYISIYKKIKRKKIVQMHDETIKISPKIKPAPPKSDSKQHQKLKSKIEQILIGKKLTPTFETANFDVYAYDPNDDRSIVVECGKTDCQKLIDSIENIFTDIKDIKEFWVLDFYDSKYNSKLYKFKINK